MFTAARLELFKHCIQTLQACGDIKHFIFAITPPDRMDLIFPGDRSQNWFFQNGKKFFKDIWHPVPTRPHVKCKACGFKFSCPATGSSIFFKYRYLKSFLARKHAAEILKIQNQLWQFGSSKEVKQEGNQYPCNLFWISFRA